MSNHNSALRIAVQLAPRGFYRTARDNLAAAGVVQAVRVHDTAAVFDWVVSLLDLQGISDRAAAAYRRAHPPATFATIQALGRVQPQCERLRAWWLFECGYRKSQHSCAKPFDSPGCYVPRLGARKGILAEAIVSLWLFIRDVMGGDLVGWIDRRLATHDPGPAHPKRGELLGAVLLDPLLEIRGLGPKILNMILADLLLAGDPDREVWVAAGASMVAIDTLVHAFFERTGTLRRAGAQHSYGPACYEPGGCADIIRDYATTVDVRAFEPDLPNYCPRYIQHAIWFFCAEGGHGICNGTKIDDRAGCQQVWCPAFVGCERLPRLRANSETSRWRP